MGRSLLSSPFFVSTSAAFCFDFCFDLLAFQRSNCASRSLHWNRRLAALIVLCDDYIPTPLFAFSGCLFLPAEVPVPKLKFPDQDRCPRTSILPNKLIYHLANQSFPTKSWNLAPNRDNLLRENHFLFYKITLVDETHLHAGRHYYLTALNKSLRTSRETNFRLIQAFNWSKSNFGEIHISQGLDWTFRSLFHYGSCMYQISTVPVLIKGRTIRKLMLGAGEVQTKYSREGKVNEKNLCMPINPKKYSCYVRLVLVPFPKKKFQRQIKQFYRQVQKKRQVWLMSLSTFRQKIIFWQNLQQRDPRNQCQLKRK